MFMFTCEPLVTIKYGRESYNTGRIAVVVFVLNVDATT